MRKLSKREQKIARFSERIGPACDVTYLFDYGTVKAVGDEAEKLFRLYAEKRHGLEVSRAGWPDFLVEDRKSKRQFCVEVKSEHDKISARQAMVFDILGRAGLPVFVWWTQKPNVLIPWRKFFATNGCRRSYR